MISSCYLQVYPLINSRIPETIFMKLGMSTIAPESTSTAYFINPSHRVLVSIHLHATVYAFSHNLLNVLIQIANKMGLHLLNVSVQLPNKRGLKKKSF
jgi:hypothetical protein